MRSEPADGTTEEKVRPGSLESLQGQARLETRVSVPSDEVFRKLLRAGAAQEGLKMDMERETATLSDNKESRTFFFKRFEKKGITEEVWEWFPAHPEGADVAVEASESESTSANGPEVVDDRKVSQKAKALESFGGSTKAKAQSLDPAKTHAADFRRAAGDLESKVKGHVQPLGTSMEWGCNCFRASLSLAARKRTDDCFGEEPGEEPGCEERLSEAARHLCDETSESEFRRNCEDEFRRLERKNCKFVDAMSSSCVRLRGWFPGTKPDFEDQRLDFERLLKKHRFAKELQSAVSNVSFNGDCDSMVSFLRQREKMPAESFLPKAPHVQKKKWEVSSACTECLMGKCKKGKECHKKHEGKPARRFFHKKGTCRFGDGCKCRHAKELPGEKKDWKPNRGKSLGIDAGDVQHKAAKDEPNPNPAKKEKEVAWDELSLELTAVNLAELAESMSKPCEEDPTLRRRRKASVHLEGSKGVFKGKALVDSGSQPTSVHASVLQKFEKLGIPFTFAARKQRARSFNGGASETLGEAAFEVKFREAKSKASHIKVKTWATVTKATVAHDFPTGMDVQNLCSMAVHGDPDPKLRRLTVLNKETESQPCSQKGEGCIASELKLLSSELPEMWDVNKPDVSNNREAAEATSSTPPTFESLADAPDQRPHKVENGCQFITEEEAGKGVSEIMGATAFPDQAATANKDVTEDPAMVSPLDRIESEMKCGDSVMDTKEQFWHVRFTLCRFQRAFVKELSRCGGFRSEPRDVLPWLKPGVKPLRQQPHRLPPDELMTLKEAVKQLCDADVFCKVDDTDTKWASPGFPAWDKGKTMPRVVAAMQKLNDLCKLQHNVAPITEVTLTRVLNSPRNAHSDAKGGHRQVPCTIMTQRMFTMVVLWGAFASNSLPVGCKNSVQTFCEKVDEVCSELKDTATHVDDVTDTGVNHLAGCLEFTEHLSKCEEKNSKLSAKKLQEVCTPLRLFDEWAMWLGGFPMKLRKDSRCAMWSVKHGQDKMREPWTRMSAACDPWMMAKHEHRQRDLHVNPDTFTCESEEAKTTSKCAARKTLKTLFPDQHEAAGEFLKGCKERSKDKDLEVHPAETPAVENEWGLPLTETTVWEISDATHETNSPEASTKTTVSPDKDTLKEEQRGDFAKHFAALESAESKNHESAKSQHRIEGELSHKMGSFEVGGAVPLLICVPKECTLRMPDAHHVDNLSNHRNATDLAARTLKSHHWPGLNRECRTHVKGCQVCIRAKTKLKKLPHAQNKCTVLFAALRDEAKFKANFTRNASPKTKCADCGVGDQVWLHREDSRKANPVTTKHDLMKTGPVAVVSVNGRSNAHRVVDERTGCCAAAHAKCLSPLGRFRVLPEVEDVSSDEESGESSPSESSSGGGEDEDGPPALEGWRGRGAGGRLTTDLACRLEFLRTQKKGGMMQSCIILMCEHTSRLVMADTAWRAQAPIVITLAPTLAPLWLHWRLHWRLFGGPLVRGAWDVTGHHCDERLSLRSPSSLTLRQAVVAMVVVTMSGCRNGAEVTTWSPEAVTSWSPKGAATGGASLLSSSTNKSTERGPNGGDCLRLIDTEGSERRGLPPFDRHRGKRTEGIASASN
eukprot:jgi/Bigna1/78027/fgenesh1_pg.52_\